MKVKYKGPSFGADGLTNNFTYEVLEVDQLTGALRLIDDSGEDYLYSPTAPGPVCSPKVKGRFEIVEDDAQGTLKSAISETTP